MKGGGASSAETLPLPRMARHAAGTAFLGMVMFMASWAMLFAGLFFAYGIVRRGATAWPPPDLPPLPLALPALASALLFASEAVAERALVRLRAGDRRPLAPGMFAAAALGAGFLALQIHTWQGLWAQGLVPATGTYASVFYTLTVFHGLHVAVGVVGLLIMGARAAAGAYDRERHVPPRLWTLYWHMVGVIWAIMYVLVYWL